MSISAALTRKSKTMASGSRDPESTGDDLGDQLEAARTRRAALVDERQEMLAERLDHPGLPRLEQAIAAEDQHIGRLKEAQKGIARRQAAARAAEAASAQAEHRRSAEALRQSVHQRAGKIDALLATLVEDITALRVDVADLQRVHPELNGILAGYAAAIPAMIADRLAASGLQFSKLPWGIETSLAKRLAGVDADYLAGLLK